MQTNYDISPDEEQQHRIEALELWAVQNASSNTRRFDREAQAAEIVLGLFERELIMVPA